MPFEKEWKTSWEPASEVRVNACRGSGSWSIENLLER
jgi:hypothetical protein